MRALTPFSDPNLLVGADSFSDAGVYRIAPDLAIVQSVDFFAPIVDDPHLFGQIAAANALSDLYAMGARPLTALNIVGFPEGELDIATLGEILQGGAERVAAAGAVVVGGHSVRDTEVKFGLSVTGVAHPDRLLTNARAAPGDALVLTKPLGVGFITTANRAGRCPPEVFDNACASMIVLNDAASKAALAVGACAATDVTGFGLAVHAWELASASGVTIEIDLATLPILPGAGPLATRENFTRATESNRRHAASSLTTHGSDSTGLSEFLYDAQTSGGLLVSIPPARAGEFLTRCRDAGLSQTVQIGRIRRRGAASVLIHAS